MLRGETKPAAVLNAEVLRSWGAPFSCEKCGRGDAISKHGQFPPDCDCKWAAAEGRTRHYEDEPKTVQLLKQAHTDINTLLAFVLSLQEYTRRVLGENPARAFNVIEERYRTAANDAAIASVNTELAAKAQIRVMVNRFLAWRLPSDFAPDGGISFNPHRDPQAWPVGTNLFTADQAEAMIRHILASPAVEEIAGAQEKIAE